MYLTPHKNGSLLSLYIQPNAKKSEMIGLFQSALKCKIAAPALENKANETLLEFLALFFKLPYNHFSLLKGQRSKYKTVLIQAPLNQIKPILESFLDSKNNS